MNENGQRRNVVVQLRFSSLMQEYFMLQPVSASVAAVRKSSQGPVCSLARSLAHSYHCNG
ncbi:hypothetical protein E2C01_069471 [Portunus trituberculatus]|uniref:Uncharacterized protein n=1 Tax=Portunus trituberculatus TaxID=210409 RepID=A0A5B7HZF7_PORTR|nr:hypothetical protein [Portunus trituberculatus]